MAVSRELRGVINVLERGKIISVLLLTIVLLTSSTQGCAIELNKNQGIMLPDQSHQIVKTTKNITITCL
jgi:hypothetical protein